MFVASFVTGLPACGLEEMLGMRSIPEKDDTRNIQQDDLEKPKDAGSSCNEIVDINMVHIRWMYRSSAIRAEFGYTDPG